MAKEISFQERIGCIDRYINQNKELIRVFDGDDQFLTDDCKREIAILESIREELELDAGITAGIRATEEAEC